MARTPRAQVSKTSGQGVSRLSYQKGYSLRNKGGGDIKGPSNDTRFGSDMKGPGRTGGSRNYGKGDTVEGFNVSYGETFHPTDLKDVEGAFKDKPAKGLDLTPKGAKRYSKGK